MCIFFFCSSLELKWIVQFLSSSPQMSFHVIYKAPCGLCLRNMAEIQHYLFQTRCDFIFLEMFCLDPYVLVDRPFQPQRPFYYIPDITGGREDIPLSCVNEIDSTPPPKVAYSKNYTGNKGEINLGLWRDQTTQYCLSFRDDQVIVESLKQKSTDFGHINWDTYNESSYLSVKTWIVE